MRILPEGRSVAVYPVRPLSIRPTDAHPAGSAATAAGGGESGASEHPKKRANAAKSAAFIHAPEPGARLALVMGRAPPGEYRTPRRAAGASVLNWMSVEPAN